MQRYWIVPTLAALLSPCWRLCFLGDSALIEAGEAEPMLEGLRTVIYPVADLARAKTWYSTVLGPDPYFDEPFYVGYTVGGFELGLDPNGTAASATGGGPVAYWGVPDISAAYRRLHELGAGECVPVQDVGGGIRTAVVTDPFGNAVGLIENPHFRVEDVR